jgi:hypothetical protein
MSDRILLRVSPGAETHRRKAKRLAKIYELPQDQFISVEIGERQMFFELFLPAFRGRVRMTTGEMSLKPPGGMNYNPPERVWRKFAWNKEPGDVASQRVRPLTIRFEASDGNVVEHTLQLQVMPEPLDTLPKLLLDDLTYQLYLDWQQAGDDTSRPLSENKDRPRFNSWTTLETELPGVLAAMAQIGQRPFQQLKSGYQFQPFRYHQRLDPHTYRWLAQRGLQPNEAQFAGHQLPIPYSQPTDDCPENHFVYAVLQLATQMLRAMEAIFAGENYLLSRQHFLAVARSGDSDKKRHRTQVEEIQQKLADLDQKQQQRKQLLRRCTTIIQSPFFQQWHQPQISSGLTQPPVYSLVLTQNPAYRQIFEFYTRLMASNQADALVRTSRFIEGVQRAGQAKRAAIYETWLFVRLYRDLRLLGFVPESGHDLNSMIEGSRLTPTLYSGDKQWLELRKDLPNNNDVILRLFHEKDYWDNPPLPEKEQWAWRPDVTLEVRYCEQRYLFFLDAKFLDFAATNKAIHLRDELFATPRKGIEKYLDIPKAQGSFILHPATHPDFENYGASIPENNEAFEPGLPGKPALHRLGYLPFRPQQTTAFRKWLGLIFILHLRQYQYCWNCHQTNVHRSPRTPNCYECLDCKTTWQLSRCDYCGFGPVFSGEEAPFNYFPGVRRPLCSQCGQEI